MAKIGDKMICANCGKETIRTSGGQKYCDECKVEAHYMRARDTERRSRDRKNADKPLREFVCRNCHTIFQSRYRRFYCEECAKEVHMKQILASNKAKAEAVKEYKPVVIETPKPKFSLAEVEAAARKNNMNYGRYVAAWKMGKVPAPEHVKAPKKKRGRKKKHEEER